MPINSCNNYFCKPQINLKTIEQDILKAQAKIYQAALVCKLDTIIRSQNTIIASKSFFLIIARNLLNDIKKKITCGIHT